MTMSIKREYYAVQSNSIRWRCCCGWSLWINAIFFSSVLFARFIFFRLVRCVRDTELVFICILHSFFGVNKEHKNIKRTNSNTLFFVRSLLVASSTLYFQSEHVSSTTNHKNVVYSIYLSNFGWSCHSIQASKPHHQKRMQKKKRTKSCNEVKIVALDGNIHTQHTVFVLACNIDKAICHQLNDIIII